ncbi:efflux RND transporter periplasmic adaptor subunit [Marivirga harenae]|uniref:efflux RND transporter periplasmic adaptor subunit n=1 Tax=Marivirga harenae TaxID=2010992 RepID=UPI0026E07D5E|nr:efflux RND transporter periplasmic adaptor subunit [Marivirga harenae]WKV11034.1 efflux RND transporter periplasmic adaptor subunit [Marivirga harenae]|tara:strand:- start:118144 stop:119241 length:1098 start_codon:yes stop_codon:yes gene_type:complete
MKIINILIISSLLAFGACSGSEETVADGQQDTKNEISLSESQIKNTNLKVAKLEKAPLDKKITTFGALAVAPEDIAELHLVHRAFIEGTKILPGEAVQKGQVLASFSHPDILTLQSNYLAAVNNLKQLEADYQRKKTLVEDQSISLKSFQAAEAKYFEEKVNIDAKKSMLQKLGINIANLQKGNLQNVLRLRAPFNGVITEVNISNGMMVEPKESLFELINLDEMHLEFNIFPKDVDQLKEGQRVTFKLPEGNKWYESSLHFINKKVNDNSVLAHADLPEAVNLPLGAQLEVEVHITTDSLILIPKKGILRKGKETYIFVETSQGSFQKKQVQVANENEEFIGIDPKDLDQSKKYVVEGAYYLNQ